MILNQSRLDVVEDRLGAPGPTFRSPIRRCDGTEWGDRPKSREQHRHRYRYVLISITTVSVRYEAVNVMLLNEFLKEHRNN